MRQRARRSAQPLEVSLEAVVASSAMKSALVGVGGVVALITVGILGLRAVLLSKACDRYESVLSTDTQGRTLSSTFEACSFIGNQNEQWVDLELPSGKSERV